MNKHLKHIAVIPAREGSVGLPKKNQLLFDSTAKFLEKLNWISEVIVTSDDQIILDKAISNNFKDYKRSNYLSGSDISIKLVFKDLIDKLNFKENYILWLFYLPIVYKNLIDFQNAKKIIEKNSVKSLCSFVPSKTHPFYTWRYDDKNKKISQFIKNDVFRRQDLPSAWMHYHYLCCFKVSELDKLNNELLNSETHPIFLTREYSKNLIEIDSKEDLEKWHKINNKL
ncbi:hypothetical protein [Candidatus Pelagibacter sp. HIMB1495]|uniref:hypothetical protein n=1 Tax=unclassified Candidatus Pelagibacter TaxID=2647897 RepID=UPI003F82B9A9